MLLLGWGVFILFKIGLFAGHLLVTGPSELGSLVHPFVYVALEVALIAGLFAAQRWAYLGTVLFLLYRIVAGAFSEGVKLYPSAVTAVHLCLGAILLYMVASPKVRHCYFGGDRQAPTT
jgi:hypothetical protein